MKWQQRQADTRGQREELSFRFSDKKEEGRASNPSNAMREQVFVSELVNMCRKLERENSKLKQENLKLTCLAKKIQFHDNMYGGKLGFIQQLHEEEQKYFLDGYHRRMSQLGEALRWLKKCYVEALTTKKSERFLQKMEKIFKGEDKNVITRSLEAYRKEFGVGQITDKFVLNLRQFTSEVGNAQSQVLRKHVAKLAKTLTLCIPQIRKEIVEIQGDSQLKQNKLAGEVQSCLAKYFQNRKDSTQKRDLKAIDINIQRSSIDSKTKARSEYSMIASKNTTLKTKEHFENIQVSRLTVTPNQNNKDTPKKLQKSNQQKEKNHSKDGKKKGYGCIKSMKLR